MSLLDLDLKYESKMKIGFSYIFHFSPCPQILVGIHPLINIREKNFSFFNVDCYFQNK
jgi:hypothetical protein